MLPDRPIAPALPPQRYEGQWVADRKQGEGVLVFENGTVFEGMFEDDKPVVDDQSRDLFLG